jgi:hypothetical protein
MSLRIAIPDLIRFKAVPPATEKYSIQRRLAWIYHACIVRTEKGVRGEEAKSGRLLKPLWHPRGTQAHPMHVYWRPLCSKRSIVFPFYVIRIAGA